MKTFILPLLYDHHNHPCIYSALSGAIELGEICSKEKALELIRHGKSRINLVVGWNDSMYSFTKNDLESLPSVFISNLSLHCFLINSAAREIIAAENPMMAGKIEDQLWVEKNLPMIYGFMTSLIPFDTQMVDEFFSRMEALGILSFEEKYLSGIPFMDYVTDSGYNDRMEFWTGPEEYAALDESRKQKIKGIKLFTDGALGAATAAMNEAYLCGGKGILIYTDNELYKKIATLSAWSKPFSVHAIGDAATAQVTRVLGRLKTDGLTPSVWMEHCQFITDENARKLKDMGVILSMQPNFNYDSVYYKDRLKKKYLEINNPFRMLVDKAGFIPGKDLLLGSDGMPHGAKFALEQSLFPPFPDQRLTVEEFIAGYCMESVDHGCIEAGVDEDNGKVKILRVTR
ncbi:MAG: amidohydrolase family protein [Bacteroidetes bacterium]|nr:amidohydrolase family protein [Bacteroidota bacterium]